MNALLKKTDEVNLHSNFIYSMINPESNHYCGNIFLNLFLEAINENGFITLDNAKVHKEVGKIDLLIEDGERVIIIENKLRAVDQKHQISRYVKYCVDNYLKEYDGRYEDRIRIVYLSEYKKIPSKDKQSCYGFEELSNDSTKMKWLNKEVSLHNSGKLNLPKDTTLNFNRVQHSRELLKWVDKSNDWLNKNKQYSESRTLNYAFKEYGLILERLDTKNNWRNLMTLDQYTLTQEDNEQQDMYAFMSEAHQKFNEYLGKKLYQEIDSLFPEDTRENCIIENREFKEFNEVNCIRWFQKWKTKEKYRDVAFKTTLNGKNFIFGLGVTGIVYKLYDGNFEWNNPKFTRENLQKNTEDKNLFTLIKDLKENYAI